jgi:hypothetical protein
MTSLTKDVKDLCIEKFKTVKKDTEEHIRRRKHTMVHGLAELTL